jgi:transposase
LHLDFQAVLLQAWFFPIHWGRRQPEYYKHALALGYVNLSIVVEPSGCYEKKLTSSALQKGYSVWTINPERMYKAGVVHHGDDGKSDPLDGKVLYMMAQMGNVLRLVPLSPQWQKLRELGLWMEDATLAAADARIHIGTLRRGLFVDWDQSLDLSWDPTGRTLQEVYGFDPWHITQCSVEEFIERMRAHRKGLPRKCLLRIWQQAQCSCSAPLSDDQREGIGAQLSYYWDIWTFHERRKHELAEQMVAIVEAMNSGKEWIPPLVSGFTAVTRAKILAETGPLYMFTHWRALLAYAGLKVRMRSSGNYRGKDKITKKGRVLLRKHLGQAAWVLSPKDRILGPYYHRKLSEGMPARKAKVACMRKLVKFLYGAAKSNQQFDQSRIYRSAG